jgi:hypothetical protein
MPGEGPPEEARRTTCARPEPDQSPERAAGSPCCASQRASWVRELSPSLPRRLAMCPSTVRGETTSASAIGRFASPRATRAATSRSRAVSDARAPPAPTGAREAGAASAGGPASGTESASPIASASDRSAPWRRARANASVLRACLAGARLPGKSGDAGAPTADPRRPRRCAAAARRTARSGCPPSAARIARPFSARGIAARSVARSASSPTSRAAARLSRRRFCAVSSRPSSRARWPSEASFVAMLG